jgi:hypothetical protein
VFDESTGVPRQIFRISLTGSRSVFPQQPGLKVVVPRAGVCIGSFSPVKSPSRSSSVEVIPREGYSFLGISDIPSRVGDWSDIEFLNRVARAVP